MARSFRMPDPETYPRVGDNEHAAVGLDRWREDAAKWDDPALADFATRLADDEAGCTLLKVVFGNSPFLTRCLLQEPALLQRYLDQGPDRAFASLTEGFDAAIAGADDAPILMRQLRLFKRRAALLIGLADITGQWPLDTITGALSDTAERCLQATAAFLLRRAATQGAFALPHTNDPERDSGFIILGMGKLGGRELNYSSDIDLVVLYDDEVIETDQPDRLQQAFVRITRDLVRFMEERTAEGYVFRTDLRLRPDPGSTPLAISVLAAETYYESLGQNWERAAMIKARPVAGDLAAGSAFLDQLKPFIWRKHLDFAAIEDIHSIKRQINAHRGGSKIAVAGHNIKLGRGGIREIELFAQTQQLIWGGRMPALRTRTTCDTLQALVEADRQPAATAAELTAAYHYLRRVEHRLQMVDDNQTHNLPDDDAELDAFARFMGHETAEGFAAELLGHLRKVETHYAHLFEEASPLAQEGNLVFTGGEHDPETLATLRGMGFGDPEAVSAAARRWHHGRYRAVRSARAREILTELMPGLLTALARTADPDSAFLKFDEFLSRLPTGVQLFSMFHANPGLLDLVAEIMGTAPQLSEQLSRRPSLFDAVLEPGFFDPLPDADSLTAQLEKQFGQARDFQDVLDVSRRWVSDHVFQVGVQMLRGQIDADAAGRVYSDIADAALRALQPVVEAAFAEAHGRVADGGMVVVALGKLGSREMTATSDLDLMFVYDAPETVEHSDGEKPLSTSLYFARLSQRLLNALTAQTPEGRLYEVDMRLRPSGSAGPLATSLGALNAYYNKDAWVWEEMALTRARVASGPGALAARVGDCIVEILTRPRPEDRLLRGVAEMRQRIDREHGSQSIWDAKYRRGALIDIEFLTQYFVLRYAAEAPDIVTPNTGEALRRLAAAGLVDEAMATRLLEAGRLWRRQMGVLRLTSKVGFDEDAASPALRALLTRALECESFDALKELLSRTADAVYDIFRAEIEKPAARLLEETPP